MHFCEKCDNMYYIKVDPNLVDKLIYYCRKCGNENVSLTSDNICVSKVYIRQTKQQLNNIVNTYTINDPTLPRSNTIKCPTCSISNSESSSSSNNDNSSEVIYIRYDDANMKYVYLCTNCNTTWKTMDRK